MAGTPSLYQETRISLPPASPSSTLHINTAPSNAIATSGAGRKRPFDEISGLDEDSYARKHLATEGSVFFRPTDKFPRSFLWRELNDRRTLEVRSVDLIRGRKDASRQSDLTYRIDFPDKIIPAGVALADAEAKDGLEIFVLTAGNDLYTITLRRDLLLRETVPADFDASTCVKRYSSGSFSYKHPYRIVATSSLELLVSLHDGSLLRLTREVTDSGAQWRETHFSEGGWSGTLKRSFPVALYKQRTERYGNIDLFGDAIAAIAQGPTKEQSTAAKVIWTVSLDHTIKAWDLGTGKILSRSDLVESDDDEDSKKPGRYMMSPEQGTLIQIVTLPTTPDSQAKRSYRDVLYWIVAHSPKDHQFKFHAVKDNPSTVDNDEPLVLQDAQPSMKLIPPIDDLMETNIWHLEQFAAKPGPGWNSTQLWIRARSGAVCKTFMLTFDLLDSNRSEDWDLEATFKTGWTVVDSSSQGIEQLRESSDFTKLDLAIDGAATPSEKWIEFLFSPGRFSEVSLETALHIYRKGRNLQTIEKSIQGREEPLKERLVNAITAKILLKRSQTEQPEYDRYQADLQVQWNTFFRILSHLHKRRCESVGFAWDQEEGLPWTVCADFVAPVRTSTSFEMLCINASVLMSGDYLQYPQDLGRRLFPTTAEEHDEDGADEDPLRRGRIMETARRLRRFFSPVSQEKMRSIALTNALDASEEMSADDVLQSIYQEAKFQDEVREEDYEALNDLAEQFDGLGSLDVNSLLAVLEATEDDAGAVGADLGESLARYGEHMTSVVVRESYQRTEAVLLDILAIVVLLHCDLEPDSLHEDFRAQEVYEAIVLRLRNNELRKWLNANVRREGSPSGEIRTLYESMFAQDFEAKPDRAHVSYGLPEMLTGWSKHWAYDLNLSDWGGITEHILADLLKHKETDLALDFEKFLPDTPFISYLRGRLFISVGEYGLASHLLQRVHEEMGTQPCPQNHLLSDEEVNYFGKGVVFYLQHISSLFEKLKAFSYTADLTGLALSQINEVDLEQALMEVDRRKSTRDSPIKQRLSDNIEEVRILKLKQARDELLNRRFNALVQTGHFEPAFETLLQVRNPAIQKASLQQLLKACIDRNAVSTLLSLPMTDDLVSEADAILLQLAKKNMASGLPSGPQYHQILYSFRTQHSDFRGAAAILYEHLEHLQYRNRNMAIPDPEDETLVRIYVLLINTLACCGDGEGWLLADPIPGVHEAGRKRRLVRLEDLRRMYADELDRRSEVLQGCFPLVGGEEMDLV